ncbi:uncharacterized protein LOC126264318 [Aethina tumida]|uniref:uncharacterized protein LOC126264318 n=1 Tax=Aethina tumida TaxID=116153 RepID=UPI0021491EF4|nr:uncharacterized protein LOC126264318 [Aethina tumida]
MLEYYRESLFDEMKQFHEIKAVLSEEASKLQSKIKTNKVVNITDNKSSELYKKYKALLKQNQSELKMKEDLIDKLRADRKMLYIKISKIKQENEEKESASKSEIEKLKVSLNHWRDKYNKLENRRKLELTRSGIV